MSTCDDILLGEHAKLHELQKEINDFLDSMNDLTPQNVSPQNLNQMKDILTDFEQRAQECCHNAFTHGESAQHLWDQIVEYYHSNIKMALMQVEQRVSFLSTKTSMKRLIQSKSPKYNWERMWAGPNRRKKANGEDMILFK